MNVRAIKRVYFVGIGGIGMSALARFFKANGANVSGYDRTSTELTSELEAEGMTIHFTDDIELLDKNAELVVYTPAIPASHTELKWYRDHDFQVFKRSDVLQWITQSMHAVTVAGTHGKTTISTMIAFLLREAGLGCNAFLGGISVNYNTNYWSSENDVAVVEADEYDRSFLKLRPDIAVLTAIDPDHLDIYGTAEEMEAAFVQYTCNIKPGGTLIVKHGLHRNDLKGPTTITYSLSDPNANVFASNIRVSEGGFVFDMVSAKWELNNIELPIGGLHNVENATAAITAALLTGAEPETLTGALKSFKGIRRRFEYVIHSPKQIFIDDYAHHPEELTALITSARTLFPDQHCTVCFQPHLFSRTRDLADGFAQSLDMADTVLLLDIYPARELPIDGVSSEMIKVRMKQPNTFLVSKDEMLDYIENNRPSLLITSGAGDIDKLVPKIKNILNTQP